jgi:hypothetical protein
MEENKGADPKLIVAVQMTSIGVILIILGVAVFLLSPLDPAVNPRMTSYIRMCSIISNATITLLGVAFAVGGLIRHHEIAKKKQ